MASISGGQPDAAIDQGTAPTGAKDRLTRAAGGAWQRGKASARRAGRKTVGGAAALGRNAMARPLCVALGAFVTGAAAGALLPRSKGEQQLMRGLGRRISSLGHDQANRAIAALRSRAEDMRRQAMTKVGAAVLDKILPATATAPAG